ncbi:MAG: MFS transporter [Chloroflexi bacterium]|nr:MFS transporter [Chloroflexota bacterium]
MFIKAAVTWPGRVFYGWWIVAAGSAIGALNSGLYYYGFGAFFTPILNEFQWSRAELSGAFSIAQAEAGLVAPIAGILIDRLGPRRIITAGISLIGIAYLILPLTNGLMMFYGTFVLLSVGASLGTTSLPFMACLSNWFIRHRGTAAGILMGGFGIGGGLGTFFLGWSIAVYGWRAAAIASGIIFWLVGFPAARVMRHRPEELGCLPDGDTVPPNGREIPPSAAIPRLNRAARHVEAQLTPRQALVDRAFWLLSIIFALRNLVSAAVAVHEVPFLVDRGYTLEEATALLAFTVWASIVGRVFWGWMGDRCDRRWVLVICNVMLALGVFIMTEIPDQYSLGLVVVFILVFAPAYGGTVPVSIAMVADYFGRRHYATIQGLCSGIGVVGSVIGPVLAGYFFDVSHSYVFALRSFALVALVSVPLFWFVRRPSAGGSRAGSGTPAVQVQ